MLAQSVILLAIPINNPFPVTLVLSAITIAAFSAELAIAKLRVHPHKWMYILMAICVTVGAILTAWSGYYTIYGPPAAEPIFHVSGMHNPYYVFYTTMWAVNVVIALLIIILAPLIGILLSRQKE